MSDTFHSHAALIDAVGRAAVRARFGLSWQALHNWCKRGIPFRVRPAFALFAASAGKSVPADFLGEAVADREAA